jgi:3-hydroxyacyl-[acyl-carrier-protein] dehydratase
MSKIRQEMIKAAMGPAVVGQDGSLERAFVFPPNFSGFDGHFPGYPILPAVVQIEAGVLLAEEMGDGGLSLTSVERAKFQKEINPNMVVRVCCRKVEDKPGRFEVVLNLDQGTASNFVLVFQEPI